MNLMMLASLAGIAMAPQTKVANKTFLGTYANITPVTIAYINTEAYR